jgi:hypothetical protein
MLIKAWVVDDFGIEPNWLLLIFIKTAGLTYSCMMNTSATLESIGVREIGLKCSLTSFTILCFGTGTISASFHDGGNLLSRKELFIISSGEASVV